MLVVGGDNKAEKFSLTVVIPSNGHLTVSVDTECLTAMFVCLLPVSLGVVT